MGLLHDDNENKAQSTGSDQGRDYWGTQQVETQVCSDRAGLLCNAILDGKKGSGIVGASFFEGDGVEVWLGAKNIENDWENSVRAEADID